MQRNIRIFSFICSILIIISMITACESKEQKIDKLIQNAEKVVSDNNYKHALSIRQELDKIDSNKESTKKVDDIVLKKVEADIDKFIDDKKFDEAIQELEAVQKDYSAFDTDYAKEQVDRIGKIKKSNEAFTNATDLFNNKKYSEAMTKYNEVVEEDKTNYKSAKDKIQEITDITYNDYVNQAEEAFSKNDYSKAIENIDLALSVKNVSDAQNLKEKYVNAQNAEAERVKAEAVAKAQAEAAAKAKVSANANNNTNTNAGNKVKGYSESPSVPDFGALYNISANISTGGQYMYALNDVKGYSDKYIAYLTNLGFKKRGIYQNQVGYYVTYTSSSGLSVVSLQILNSSLIISVSPTGIH